MLSPARSLVLAGVTACAFTASASRADSDHGKVTRAEQRFREGEELFEQKRFAEACAAFLESQRLDPKLGTLLNVAFCHEQEGRTATAWAEYNTAAAWAMQQGRPDREKFAYDHATELAKKLSRVQLELPPGQHIGVDIDGHPHRSAQVTSMLYLDPGQHTVRVMAPGKRPWVAILHVPDGPSSQSVIVPPLVDDVLVAASSAESPPAPEAMTPLPTENAVNVRRTLSFIIGGLGIAGLGVGTYFGVRTLDKKSSAQLHCVGKECDAQGVAALDDAHTSSTISTIAFGAGALFFGAGIYLLVTSPSAPSTAITTTSARVVPLVTTRGGGLSLEGAF